MAGRGDSARRRRRRLVVVLDGPCGGACGGPPPTPPTGASCWRGVRASRRRPRGAVAAAFRAVGAPSSGGSVSPPSALRPAVPAASAGAGAASAAAAPLERSLARAGRLGGASVGAASTAAAAALGAGPGGRRRRCRGGGRHCSLSGRAGRAAPPRRRLELVRRRRPGVFGVGEDRTAPRSLPHMDFFFFGVGSVVERDAVEEGRCQRTTATAARP